MRSGSEQGRLRLLVDRLLEVPTLRDPAGRRVCLELLRDHLGVELTLEEQFPNFRTHVFALVLACRRQHPLALPALADVLEQLEPGSLPVRRVREAMADMEALDLVRETDRGELLALLAGSGGEGLARFVREAAGPALLEEVPERHEPAEALALLERLNAGPDGMPPLLLFVEILAAYFGDQRAEHLRRWNDRQAERMGLTEQVLALRIEGPAEPPPPKDVVACLVIRLETDLLDPDVLTAVHWCQSDPVHWHPRRGEPFSGTLDAVRAHVAGLVAEAESGWASGAAAIRVEFLLPYSLLNLPVDQWDLEAASSLPRPMGLHYQVVLRSLDRAREARFHREWRRRWETLKLLRAGDPDARQRWLFSDGSRPRQLAGLDAELALHKEIVSLVLRSAPNGAESGEVLVGVRGGVPVMIWHRTDGARIAFETEVLAMRDDLPDLAESLRRLRSRAKQATRPDSHVGSRVSLLWDDPERPVEPPEPPAAPSEEVTAS